MNKKNKYQIPHGEFSVAEEPVGTFSASVTSSVTNHQVGQLPANDSEISPEDWGRIVCYSDENFEFHKRHGFYRDVEPSQCQYNSLEELLNDMDGADSEGYISDPETEHLMNLWKTIS